MSDLGCFGTIVVVVIFIVILVASSSNKTAPSSASPSTLTQTEKAAADARVAETAERLRVQLEKRLEEEAEAARIRARQQKVLEKETKLRAFALKELAEVWESLQALEGQLVDCRGNKDHLAETLAMFDRAPNQDIDFQKLARREADMVSTISTIRQAIQDAYLERCKFDALAGFGDETANMASVIERAKNEAMLAENKYRDMYREAEAME